MAGKKQQQQQCEQTNAHIYGEEGQKQMRQKQTWMGGKNIQEWAEKQM